MVFFISLAMFAAIFKAYKNTQEVVINHVEIPVETKKAEEKASFHVLHLSDLHLENLSVPPETLYDQLKDKTIDIIALTGDFLDRRRTIPKLIPYLEVLQELRPTHGIYAVFGNHDYVLKGENLLLLEKTLMDYDCHILKNESTTLQIKGQIVNIIGIDDYSTNRSDIDASYSRIHPEGVNLVLTHDPNVVLEMQHVDYSYLLSGHFHGGQIHWPKPYHLAKMGKLARMNMIKGLHSHSGKPFYISEGLGQTGVNIRVGSRPEITFHNLVLK